MKEMFFTDRCLMASWSKIFISAFGITAFTLLPNIASSKQTGVANIPQASNQSCDAAIAAVKSSLAKGGYFVPWKLPKRPGASTAITIKPKVVFNNDSIQTNYYDHPTERTRTVVFQLSGHGTRLYQGLMSSPQLMAKLSAQVMAGCKQVGLVEFTHWHEGYVPVGYFPDNTARTFTWIDIGDGNPHHKTIETESGSRIVYEWGYYFSP